MYAQLVLITRVCLARMTERILFRHVDVIDGRRYLCLMVIDRREREITYQCDDDDVIIE